MNNTNVKNATAFLVALIDVADGRYIKPARQRTAAGFYYELLHYITDLVVEMITEPILYGSPLDAGRRSSSRPTQPSVGTDAGTLIEAPLSDTPYENWSMD